MRRQVQVTPKFVPFYSQIRTQWKLFYSQICPPIIGMAGLFLLFKTNKLVRFYFSHKSVRNGTFTYSQICPLLKSRKEIISFKYI